MTSVHTRLAGLVAAALVAAAGLVGLSSGPAAAALCSGSGVNVVVDFKGLGGGVQKGCAPNGAGKSGNQVFPAAGFGLDYVTNSGFVCRVKARPAGNVCSRTPPASAYWGLYWSNGKSGKWTYSSSGVGGTSVPNGGFIAFSWQNGGSPEAPGAAPVNRKPAPATKSPTKPATKAPVTNKGTKQSGSGSSSANAPEQATPDQPSKTQAAAGASPQEKKAKAAKAKTAKKAKVKAKAKASAKASASASASASAAAAPSDDASSDLSSAEKANSAFAPEEEQDGLPTWVPILVVLALAGAAGGTAWWRRRTGAP